MHQRGRETLACPSCRDRYVWSENGYGEGGHSFGYLSCPRCAVTVPVVEGFALFAEQQLGLPADPAATLQELRATCFGDPADYARFLRHKRTRPSVDLYAAFQPFNESSRSLDAFVPLLRDVLSPGDVILDLWCRTGWSGAVLASAFPEQHVVSVWEGNHDVLGYRGFHYWLDAAARPANWDVVFHHPDHPLPFADGSAAFVHGLDTLHRYRHAPLIPDCLRVCRDDGLILFPHVHLTNSEPDPFFERGETQLHGSHYSRYFAGVLRGTGRSAVVLSERDLFEAPESMRLEDDSETAHYNACVAILPDSLLGRTLGREDPDDAALAGHRAIRNPLVTTDASGQALRVATERFDGAAGDLLSRHPMYEARLDRAFPAPLTDLDARLLFWAERHLTLEEIADRVGQPPHAVVGRFREWAEQDAVRLQAVPEAVSRLQAYYATQVAVPPAGEMTLAHLWRTAVAASDAQPYLHWTEDGSVFSYGDADTIVCKIAACLSSRGLRPGDRVLVHGIAHPEFFLAFWAAVQLGLGVVPVDPDLDAERWRAIVQSVRPALALLQHGRHAGDMPCPVLWMDVPAEEEPADALLDAAFDQESLTHFPTVSPDDAAVVLFTSGSTGEPKGAQLSHGGLFRSSDLVDLAYAWTADDRYLATGGPFTMSGLRNACITPLHAGASVVLTRTDGTTGPLGTLAACVEHGVTLLNTTPAFLSYCVQLGAKARHFADHRLRLVLSTGSALQPGLKQSFEQQFGASVMDYYGLTETSGACVFVTAAQHGLDEPGVGVPLGCLAQLVAANGETSPDEGELAIYSDNLLQGYLGAEGLEPSPAVRGGALHTGDLARRTDHGCLVLLGRRDRMLVDRNGQNFYPETIERLIDGRDDVIASRLLPYETEFHGEGLAALVVRQTPDPITDESWADALKAWLRERLPAAHVPAVLRVLSEIPMGPSGKWDVDASRRWLETTLT